MLQAIFRCFIIGIGLSSFLIPSLAMGQNNSDMLSIIEPKLSKSQADWHQCLAHRLDLWGKLNEDVNILTGAIFGACSFEESEVRKWLASFAVAKSPDSSTDTAMLATSPVVEDFKSDYRLKIQQAMLKYQARTRKK